MRVLVTGGAGFAGAWLVRDLRSAGHHVLAPGHTELEVTQRTSVQAALRAFRPDAIAHLAGIALAADAAEEPARALEVNVGGTLAVLEAAARSTSRPVLLVAGSSEVYGRPRHDDLPLSEQAPLAPVTPYALSKAGQEGVALAIATERAVPTIVTRSFNHIGPGQRAEFVLPSFAIRVAAVARGESQTIRTGNLDVRRDFTDVRDVARAYRLLLERLADSRATPTSRVVNVASGRSVAIRELLEGLCARARVAPSIEIDPDLVRADEPPEIVGDASRLRELTGWEPAIPLDQTLTDLWREIGPRRSDAAPDDARPIQRGR